MQIIVILILLGIVAYLIFDKKGIKPDDIKLFFKNIGVKAKEKFSTLLDKAKIFFNSAKRKTSENLPSVIETSNNENESANESSKIEEETIDKIKDYFNSEKRKYQRFLENLLSVIKTSNNGNESANKKDVVIRVFTDLVRWFRRLIFVVIILFILITPFIYKKTVLDYDGKYATERIVYTEEYGFCMLITYYPDYHSGDAKGFAVTNIPFEALFSEAVQLFREGMDGMYRERIDTANSKELLDSYQMLATLGDNALVDSLSKLFLDSNISTRSIQIGKYGNYFAITAKNIGYVNSKDNPSNRYSASDFTENIFNNEKIEEEYYSESDYAPVLIKP